MAGSLTADQVAEVARIKDIVMSKVRIEVDAMVELMVSKPNREFLGETEFVLRDRSHAMAGHVLDAALEERRLPSCSSSTKRGIKVQK